MEAKLQEVKQNLRRRMHEAVEVTGRWLGQVLNGYYQYHAIPGNMAALKRFRERIQQHWRRTLRRRSQRRRLPESWLARLFARWLPNPRILHPYPNVRFDAKYPKVGAVCGNAARTDLCGGRSAMTVPTATWNSSSPHVSSSGLVLLLALLRSRPYSPAIELHSLPTAANSPHSNEAGSARTSPHAIRQGEAFPMHTTLTESVQVIIASCLTRC